MKKLIKIYASTRKYWIYAVLTPIVMVAEAIFELQIPSIVGELINYLEDINEIGSAIDVNILLSKFVVPLLCWSLASLVCGVLGGIFAPIASAGFAANLKDDLYKKIMSFSFTNIDKFHSSSLITRMTTDTNWVQMSYQISIRMLFRSPTMFIYALIKAYQISPKMSSIFLVAIPIIAVGLLLIFTTAHPYFEKGIKQIDLLNESVEENVRGIRVVKSFTIEKEQISKFDSVSDKIYRFFSKASKIVNLNNPLMMISIYGVIIAIAVFAAPYIGAGTMGIGDLQALISYATQILSALMMISMIMMMLIISKPSRERIYQILIEEPTIINKKESIKEVQNGDVIFENVSFKYSEQSEKPVLNKINFEVKSGTTLGILGTTGSSKTTLVSLIARLYDVNEGSIKVGGVDVKDYDINSLRDAVSVVLQKNILFSGTIKDNLRWGDKEATDEEIVKVCEISQADGFIRQFPDSYDTYIEQGGNNVSGGQKQRLCIARALLKNPKILILDDSMSAVDTKTDKLIRDGLKDYRPDITKIIVAQRCSSVMDADSIIILDNGEVIDQGTHEELLKNSKVYQDIYYSQNQEVNKDE